MDIHEETLKIARNLIEKDPSLTDWVISKFPELKESDDERIRKAIKKALQVRCDGSRIISDEPVTLEEAISWLEKQGEQKKKQYQIYESTKDRFYKEGVEDGILIGIKKQKPAWSEEDEVELVNIIDFLNSPSTAELCPALRNNAIDWLKSLKERIQPQNRLKESLATADLENSLCDIQDGFSDTSYEYRILGEAIEFIRCTEPKPQWKPSDEQMEVLAWCKPLFADHKSKGILESLIEDLKKLMEK